jgi:hypothetical protein
MGHLPSSVGRGGGGGRLLHRFQGNTNLPLYFRAKVAGIYTVGPKNHFDAAKRNIYGLEGTEPRSLGRPARMCTEISRFLQLEVGLH